MRLQRKVEFTVTTGHLVICDPGFVFPGSAKPPYFDAPPHIPCFGGFGGDGTFSVYRRDNLIVVDTAPRLFKARTRPDFTKVQGQVGVDSGMICFLDTKRDGLTNVECGDEFLIELEIENGEYCAWIEEHDTSVSLRRCLLAFGPEPKLFLSGAEADEVGAIEKKVVQFFRAKGPSKLELRQQIESRVIELHLNWCKDRRLQVIASTMKIDLPRRSSKRNKPR